MDKKANSVRKLFLAAAALVTVAVAQLAFASPISYPASAPRINRVVRGPIGPCPPIPAFSTAKVDVTTPKKKALLLNGGNAATVCCQSGSATDVLFFNRQQSKKEIKAQLLKAGVYKYNAAHVASSVLWVLKQVPNLQGGRPFIFAYGSDGKLTGIEIKTKGWNKNRLYSLYKEKSPKKELIVVQAQQAKPEQEVVSVQVEKNTSQKAALEQGQTMRDFLKAQGVPSRQMKQALKALRRVCPKVEAGQEIEMVRAPDGSLVRLAFRQKDTNKFVTVSQKGKKYTGKVEALKVDIERSYVMGSVSRGPDGKLRVEGVSKPMENLISFLFEGRVDLSKLQPGDGIALEIENKILPDGSIMTNTGLVAACLRVGGKEHTALRASYLDGRVHAYFDEKGKPLHETITLPDGPVSSSFGKRRDPFTGCPAFHEGTDYAVIEGTPVKAAAAGVIEAKGYSSGYGHWVRVNHGNGLSTHYAHLQEASSMKAGEFVSKGQMIAHSGNSGRSTGPHLHFEVRHNGQQVDPQEHLTRSALSKKELAALSGASGGLLAKIRDGLSRPLIPTAQVAAVSLASRSRLGL